MDLNKELKFGKKALVYPTKKSINLVQDDGKSRSTIASILLFLVFLGVLGIFTKFAVIDPLASSAESGNELAAAQTELAQLKKANADYAELSEQYSRYVVADLLEDEADLLDRAEVVDFIQSKIIGSTLVSSVQVQGNIVAVTCVGLDLAGVSDLVASIKEDDRVLFVSVPTVQDQEGKTSTATMEITLQTTRDSEKEALNDVEKDQEVVEGEDNGE